jgi:hypothetical protein
MSPPKGQLWPTWQRWLSHNPLRRVSLGLGSLQVGTTSVAGETLSRPAVIFEFTCKIRPRRKAISPTKFYLKTLTNRIIPIKILCLSEYQFTQAIAELPAGQWYYCSARILLDENCADDGRTNHPTPDQFFRTIGELELVFEYDGGVLRRRYSTKALKRIIDIQMRHHTQPPKRSPLLKSQAHD